MSEETISESRRKFLVRLSLGVAAIPAALVSVPVLSALFGPLLKKPRQVWRKVADISEVPPGSTQLITFINADPLPWSGTTARAAAWIRRNENNELTAFSAHCTHLGCPVRWEEKAELFMCPCHGGVYYKDGTVAAGPPPKPLVNYEVRLNNNAIEIKTAPVPITGMEYEGHD